MRALEYVDPSQEEPPLPTARGACWGEKVRPHVDRAFSFADAPAAHAHIQDRKNVEKVVLVLR